MPQIEGKEVRVRFAPSPTGPFHLGGARTALFNWIFARQQKGKFILRIEDTDKERSKKEHEDGIFDSLKWLGLNWDEGPDVGGPFGPYRQSEREEIYEKYLNELLVSKKAYYCYCTKEELEAQKEYAVASGLPPKYNGHCKDLSEAPVGKTAEVIRFKTPEVKVEFKDMIRGSVTFDAGLFGDIAIAKDLKTPLYNFAVVIDDHEMKITHVIRGEDHISNTPKQILIARALNLNEPIFGHLPLILAPDRSKLSKRYVETSMLEYRKSGYLPESLINFLVLLGWHPKDDREIFTKEELVESFDISRVQKAGAIFNEEKLDWLNSAHLQKCDTETLALLASNFAKEKLNKDFDKELLKKIIDSEKSRIRNLDDFILSSEFFLKLPEYEGALLAWEKDPKTPVEIQSILKEITEALEGIGDSEFKKDMIAFKISGLTEKLSRGLVFWPMRVSLSGQRNSPDPVLIAEILGKEETLARLNFAIKKLS